MKVLFFTDTHIADRPPLGRADGYREQVLDKLAQVGRLTHEHGVDVAIFGGDLFHTKRPDRVSHYLIQRLQETFHDFRCPVYLLPGNHDMAEDGLFSLDRQPWGVLIDEKVRALTGEDDPYEIGPDVLLYGLPYSTEGDADPDYYSWPEGANGTYNVFAAHGSVFPPGKKPDAPYAFTTFDRIDTKDIDLFLCGHIHEHLGVAHTAHSTFCNPGSLTRTSRKASNWDRQVGVYLFDIEPPDQTYSFIPLSTYAAEDVFLERAEGLPDSDEIASFVEALGQGLVLEQAPIEEVLARLDAPEEVKRYVRQYLEAAGL